MPEDPRASIEAHLHALYEARGAETWRRVEALLDRFQADTGFRGIEPRARLDERDSVAITYADGVRREGEPPLRTLQRLFVGPLEDSVTGIHLLPFYPATSDDGFAVAEYLTVDPEVGTWSDVARLGETHRLMFDAVVNHVSASHPWFRAFLRGEAPYRDWFVTADPDADLSAVVRPRATPLLTPFETAEGTRHVWTTFSADQVDLDYANPDVLVEVLNVLLEYVRRGAEILRLDAVTYLWKEIGTSCVHHANTHRILKTIRAAMEAVAPHVVILTETNVPHEENVSYFGRGDDEAQMVYNFALPPLVLHSFAAGDAGALQQWARSLRTPSDQTAFFNFLASHDGIGVRPVERLLPPEAVQDLVARVPAHGGRVSTKRNSDGTESPYELNISYFDALSDPSADEPLEHQIERFVTAHALMLAMAGVPGIYLHSLLGSRSAPHEVVRTGRARSINREKLAFDDLQDELADPRSRRARILHALRRLLQVRRSSPAFSPWAAQEVLDTPPGVFGIRRGQSVLCLHNVTDGDVSIPWPGGDGRDLWLGDRASLAGAIHVPARGFRWIDEGGSPDVA